MTKKQPALPLPAEVVFDNNQIVSLDERITHKYRDPDMDEWSDVGQMIVYTIINDEDYQHDETYEAIKYCLVKAPGEPKTRVIKALYDSFTKACTCEHDCCGHYFGSANTVVPIGNNIYLVSCTYSRNW